MEKGVRAYVPLMQRRIPVPPDLRRALARNAKARGHFERLAPSYRRHYVAWIATAKKDETRRRRLKEAVARLAKNKKLRMK
ncbi:MAG TPA: YdeI/OmpD-associated family protein, partial [Usitatibacter sp.]|nr:YdeI/OmpD-associated family protein [Usitatibacter sp.]